MPGCVQKESEFDIVGHHRLRLSFAGVFGRLLEDRALSWRMTSRAYAATVASHTVRCSSACVFCASLRLCPVDSVLLRHHDDDGEDCNGQENCNGSRNNGRLCSGLFS